MLQRKSKVLSMAALVILTNSVTALQAAPLPDGTSLGVAAGTNPDGSGQCQAGSCFGMELSPNFWFWTDIEAGNDGGFIVGKDQLCGGQETGPSSANTAPGDISSAWSFFGAYGTFCANNTLNVFSDTSNDGTTEINDLKFAWNGTLIPLGGGNVNDYIINLADPYTGTWSMDYTTVVPSGAFVGVNFRLIARGPVTIQPCVCPPVSVTRVISGRCGEIIRWTPEYIVDPCTCNPNPPFPQGPFVCEIAQTASNGNATVSPDCSTGEYISGEGFEGYDSFAYRITDETGISVDSFVNVVVDCTPITGDCIDQYPLVQVNTVGGGQSRTVNASQQTTFTGSIVTEAGLTTGGKNIVKICPGTTVDFSVTTTVGVPSCTINSASTASTGTLAIGDKIICSNKPDGSDTDRF